MTETHMDRIENTIPSPEPDDSLDETSAEFIRRNEANIDTAFSDDQQLASYLKEKAEDAAKK